MYGKLHWLQQMHLHIIRSVLKFERMNLIATDLRDFPPFTVNVMTFYIVAPLCNTDDMLGIEHKETADDTTVRGLQRQIKLF